MDHTHSSIFDVLVQAHFCSINLNHSLIFVPHSILLRQYLHHACDDESQQLPVELVGAQPSWPRADDPDRLVSCFGSAGMADCVADVPGTIGFLEVGHGVAASLDEVRLHNRDADVGSTVFRNSRESSVRSAITVDALPSSPDEDFSAVTFVNQGGVDTWPIVLMTYINVRKDLSFIADAQEQALLVAFLRALLIPDYIQRCADLYGFTLFVDDENMKQFVELGISMVEASIDYNNATKFAFEGNDTLPVVGAGEYVFSEKRREIADVERQDLMEQVVALQAQLDELRGTSSESFSANDEISFGDSEETHLKAALALSTLSFVFWTLWAAVYITRYLKTAPHTTPAVVERVVA